MDQIKKVFSPGSTKDDELMYGSEESRLQYAADNEAKKDHSTLYPTEGQAGQEKESGGVLRQIVNPGGKKYDEQAMGTTATTEQPDPSKLQTDPDHKDHGILKQLTNPGRKAYDETAYGTTATTNDSSAPGSSSPANNQSTLPVRDTTNTTTSTDSNLSRNAAVAGGGAAAAGAGGIAAHQYNKHDNDTTGGGQTDGLADNRTGTQAAQDQSGSHGAGRDVSNATVVDRAHDNNPDKGATILAGTGTTSQSRPLGDSSLPGGSSTGYGQSSTLSTGSPRTGGITDASDNTFSAGQTGSESHIGRDAGIAGGLAAAGVGAGAYGGRNDATSSVPSTTGAGTSESVGERSHPLTSGTTHGHINPVGAPEASLSESGGLSGPNTHAGGARAGVLGSSQPNAGVSAGGVRNDEGVTQLNQAPADVQGATFLDRSFYVGKPGDSVSHGPNVPGEFPAAASVSGTSGIAQPAGTAGLAQDSTSRDTSATGISGVGPSSVAQPAPTTTTHGSTTPRSDVAQTGVPATARDLQQDTSREDHHYGRDAAVAGGVGAAAAGAGIAGRDYVEPGSTTHEAYGTEDPNRHNKLHKQPPEDKKLEKELAKEEKHSQKELEKQQHEAQKQHEKDAKERQHAAEKAEKKHEKELEKQHEKEEKDKKPSLIDRILHRTKDDKEEVVYSDEKTGQPLHIKENTKNGPLDHPLVTTATASTAAGAVGVAGASAYQAGQPHGTESRTNEPLNISENSRNGPLDHPLITAAGTLTGTGDAGASADQARPQHSTGSDLTGQRQRDVEPLLSGNNNNTIGSSTTTSTAAAGGVGAGAATGVAATQVTPSAYQLGGQNTSDLTGQRQRNSEPLLSGDKNAIGTSNTGTSSAVAGGALAAGGVAGAGAGAGALSTGGDSRIEGYQGQSGGSNTASGGPGSGLTGRRQDDVDPYIHGSKN